jgi:hypothetical protein
VPPSRSHCACTHAGGVSDGAGIALAFGALAWARRAARARAARLTPSRTKP